MKKLGVLSFILLTFLLAACQQETQGSSEISAKELESRLGDAKILDVRTMAEYDSGHVPGAELLPLQGIEANPSSYESLARTETYYIICQSGNRSSQAVALLEEQGFENLVNVTGGMNEWQGEMEK